MAVRLLSRPAAWWSYEKLPAVLLVGGSLNGLLVRVSEAWQRQGFEAVLVGVSPFELITLAVGAMLVSGSRARPAAVRPGLAEALTAAAILVPSSVASWAAVAFYASVMAARTASRERLGALLFAGVAACSIWSSLAFKWLALPITGAEAWIIGSLLSLLRDDITQSGNLIGTGTGHSIVLMTACSSLDGLPRTLLAVFAVALAAGAGRPAGLGPALAVVGLLYVAANTVRLMLIAWSAPLFEIAHGPIGTNVFDATMTLVVLAAGLGASRE